MSYFLLPTINYEIKPKNIKLKFDETNKISINKTLSKYISQVKEQISSINIVSKWDNMKKFTNPYEYIHTPVPGYKTSISRMKPLSRSFFKMMEMYNLFKIEDLYKNVGIKSFHLAEGPGGFIEALCLLRKNKRDMYYGMTLINNNINTPGWKKSEVFLKKNHNVTIELGADGTGNLYKAKNLKYCMEKYQNSMDFITADGGFDFSIDFNKQEEMAFRLIFSQISFAITMQKKNGIFILKVFDIFLQSTVELIYLLCCFYKKVYIIKPNTSRYANSEKYIVCKFFKEGNTKNISKKFLAIFTVLDRINFKKYLITNIINIPIQYFFLCQIQEINAIIGQQQIQNILTTIRMIEDDDWAKENINKIKNQNIKKCIYWCIKNNLIYNKNIQTSNMFLGKIES